MDEHHIKSVVRALDAVDTRLTLVEELAEDVNTTVKSIDATVAATAADVSEIRKSIANIDASLAKIVGPFIAEMREFREQTDKRIYALERAQAVGAE